MKAHYEQRVIGRLFIPCGRYLRRNWRLKVRHFAISPFIPEIPRSFITTVTVFVIIPRASGILFSVCLSVRLSACPGRSL